MIVAMLPGFARTAALLERWTELLAGEVRIFDLPGHGREPVLAQPSLARAADLYCERIPKDALVIGESLGGLIALEMAARGWRAVAIDPPLAPQKLWVLQGVVPQILARNPDQPWLAEFVRVFFGIGADGSAEARNYWPLLDAVAQPVDIVAASEPLWPVRPIAIAPETTPSVLDEVDAWRLARHPKVRFRQAQGPHALLTDAEASIGPILSRIVAEAGG